MNVLVKGLEVSLEAALAAAAELAVADCYPVTFVAGVPGSSDAHVYCVGLDGDYEVAIVPDPERMPRGDWAEMVPGELWLGVAPDGDMLVKAAREAPERLRPSLSPYQWRAVDAVLEYYSSTATAYDITEMLAAAIAAASVATPAASA